MDNNFPSAINGAPSIKSAATTSAAGKNNNGRFLRKAGTSSATTTPVTSHPGRVPPQPQRSFEGCSPLYSGGTPPLQLQLGQQNIDPVLLASLASGLNRHHQQQQQKHQQHHLNKFQSASVAGTTVNSPAASTIQSPVIFNEHESIKTNGQRFMAAPPRRARSAERFDGMRVAYVTSGDLPSSASSSRPTPAGTPTVGKAAPSPVAVGQMGAVRNGVGGGGDRNSYRSSPQQQIRTGSGGGSGMTTPSPAPSLPLQPQQLRQSANNTAVASPVLSVASSTKTGSIPSPPPPYSKAITETHISPPSYKQAVAAMNGISTHGKNAKLTLNGNNRYNLAHQGRSLDTGNYSAAMAAGGASLINGNTVNATSGGNGLRNVSSHPVFMIDRQNEAGNCICSCNDCQAMARVHDPSCNELNDAVYMESQAFLMHEIMNDGMAFCSIM